jgi:hypothetical protein
MAVATITTKPDGPLTKSHQDEIAAGHDRARKIRKAAAVANFNGWVTGFFAVTSAPFAFFSLTSFVVTVGLSIVTHNEFKGRNRLLRFDPTAPFSFRLHHSLLDIQYSLLAAPFSFCLHHSLLDQE